MICSLYAETIGPANVLCEITKKAESGLLGSTVVVDGIKLSYFKYFAKEKKSKSLFLE